MTNPNNEAVIPRRPLIWFAAALCFTVPPMFDSLPPWAPVWFLASLLAKFWMEKNDIRLRSIGWKLAGLVIGFAGVAFSYGSLKGVEPGMASLLVLTSFKVLEAYTARDFHILAMVGWFLCLCGFFSSQELGTALYVLIAFAVLLAAVIEFHRGGATDSIAAQFSRRSRNDIWPPLRLAFTLLLQAIPLIAVLFFLFPRGNGGFRFYATRPLPQSSTGLSERLSPGSVASITASQNVAFRAEFPDGKIPPPNALYWRGAVMWHGYGMNWETGQPPGLRRTAQRPSGQAILQRITIEPHGGRWMFALEWPSKAPPGAMLVFGDFLRSERPINSPRGYEVLSFREIRGAELGPDERNASLQIPENISPAVRNLAQSWTAANGDPRAVVRNALQFFQKGGFRYSTSPGEYAEDALDEFLFRRKIGFCEHYAASFATLMRVAGIPARVVVGYLGGQFNDFGHYLVVRQSDAHAWCEVWLPETGWTRVDPTSVVAPERVNLGFDAFLEMRDASGAQGANAGRADASGAFRGRQLLNNVRLAWDTLNFAWNTRVVNFDAEAQQSVLEQADIGNTSPIMLFTRICIAAAVLLCAYGMWLWLRTRTQRDPARMLYERFCRSVARAGVERTPTEGPADFSKRASQLLPHEAAQIQRLTSLYISLRYSPEPQAALLKAFAEEMRSFAPTRQQSHSKRRD